MEQVENKLDLTSKNEKQVDQKKVPNPSGNGGFKDNPHHINKNGRPKNDFSITYWMREYLAEKEPEHDKERYKELAELICAMASAGNRHMIKLVMERVDGKVPLELNIKNKELKDLSNILLKVYKLEDESDSNTSVDNTESGGGEQNSSDTDSGQESSD